MTVTFRRVRNPSMVRIKSFNLSLRLAVLAGLTVVVIAGCSRRENPELLQLRSSGDGPDEFSIVPNKPLQTPEDFAYLPPPSAAGSSRADATPQKDVFAALGGSAEVTSSRSSEAGLLSYTSRFGRSASIREELAASDLDFRRRNDALFLERIANFSKYFDVYAPQSLDQDRELERFRAAGYPTPAAPPPPTR